MEKIGLTVKELSDATYKLTFANKLYKKHEKSSKDKLGYSYYIKSMTNDLKGAVKDKNIDKILDLEAICQNMDSKLMASIDNHTGAEQQDRVEDVLKTVTKLWNDAKDPELIKKMYANDIAKGDLKKLVIGGIAPSIKSYRTVLRSIPGQLASTTQKNYYLKRMEAMDIVRKEYNLKIEKSLGISKAPNKGLAR